jgi:glutamine amidotransferase
MTDVVVVDYGVGNLGSVTRAFRRVGVEPEATRDPARVRAAERLVLPGVGHFGEAVGNLRASGLEAPLREAAARGAALLGICVGFQMLFESSEEAPGVAGLGLLPGRVRRFGELPGGLPVPHVGWNQIHQPRAAPLLAGVREGEHFYFLHSYYVEAGPDVTWGVTEYGVRFSSVAGQGRLSGLQFHPEKSQHVGLTVLANFLSL